VNSELHSDAIIEQVWRCTWKAESNLFGDTVGGHDRARFEMHWEALIEWVWKYAPGGDDRANLEGVIE